MRYLAAIEVDGKRLMVPAHKHVGHATRDAAVRAMERARLPGRGLVWPTNDSAAIQEGRWDAVYTVSL